MDTLSKGKSVPLDTHGLSIDMEKLRGSELKHSIYDYSFRLITPSRFPASVTITQTLLPRFACHAVVTLLTRFISAFPAFRLFA